LIAVVINKLRPLIFGSVQQLHARMQVSAKSPTGETLKHIAKYWARLCVFLDDGRIEMHSNAVERRICPIALQRKIAL
tara:strand:+ start:130 stop:363 length:234 start_codon:yes stop_codon:yes gene_type:complete